MTDQSPARLSGIILAGGASRRMGQDKAFLSIGGRRLIEHVLDAVQAVADDLVIVTNSPEKYARFPARIVRDLYPGTGVLGGIYTGLRMAHHRCGLVVACDMPFLNVELLRYMAGQIAHYDVVMPYVGRDDPSLNSQATAKVRDLHPLHAIYCKQCLEPIERALERGDLRAIAFLPEVRVRFVSCQEIDPIDPEHRSFFNTNTPAELQYARELTRMR